MDKSEIRAEAIKEIILYMRDGIEEGNIINTLCDHFAEADAELIETEINVILDQLAIERNKLRPHNSKESGI